MPAGRSEMVSRSAATPCFQGPRIFLSDSRLPASSLNGGLQQHRAFMFGGVSFRFAAACFFSQSR
eukprot:1685948-Pyramimonas_sp.AAC.1